MNKKAITILGAIFLLIVGTVGFLLFQRSSKKDDTASAPPPPVDQTEPPPPSQEPPPSEEPPPPTEEPPPPASVSTAIKLTNASGVISPVLFYQGNGVSYFNSQGQLFQADLETEGGLRLKSTRELTVPLKSGVSRVLWPGGGNNYIIEYEVSGKPGFSVYNADRGEYVDLPSNVTSINWSPLGDKIIYIWLDVAGKATLNIANPDNTGYQVITDFWEPDNAIAVSPDGKNILFYQTQNLDSPNKINIVTADGKVFKSVVKDGYNKGALWSPDSKKFLFFKAESSESRGFQVWMANLFSGDIKNLELTTSLNKVVWGADSQFVFAASAGPNGGDVIYKISLASGESEVFDPGLEVNATELFLSSTQDWVFFRNVIDGELYALQVVR